MDKGKCRAAIYFYSGSESIELQLRDLDAKQLEHIVELSDLAGAKGLNALSWAALEHRRTFPSGAAEYKRQLEQAAL